jgi:hypothetical protein
MATPKVNSAGQRELDKAEAQISAFEENIKGLVSDRDSMRVVPETEPQTKLSSREVKNADAPYIKPIRSINSKEPFDEKQREAHKKAWEYIKCVFENHEIIGEEISTWTKRFPGDPAHFWKVPVNKPVYVPRLLAKQISQCFYNRLTMREDQITSSDGIGSYTGAVVVDQVKPRLSCRTVGSSLFD